MNVRKSDGTIEQYSSDKVKSGIYAAYTKTKQEYTEEVGNEICNGLVLYDGISTEEIRDQVETKLMSYSKKAAKAYIKYGDNEAFIKDRVIYMSEYEKNGENAATSSETDPNANVTAKNVANLDGEVYKVQNRRGQRYKVVRELKRIFPEVAKDYEQDINSHIIYIHDEASAPTTKNYCEAVSLYPLLVDGSKNMDGLNTTEPKNLSSFCGQLVNLTFLLSSQCKGAVAFGEFFNYLDYFCVKDYGENYVEHIDEYADTEVVVKRKTIREKIHQAYQQIVYGWNQPSGNRCAQSPFTNISYYDKNYWEAMFKDFYFPDGTKPEWERVSYLQKDFMQWFNKERTKTLLTFPVETLSLLTDGNDVNDKDYKDFACEMWAKGHSFFVYLSDNPDTLSSCCRLSSKMNKNVFSFTSGLTGVQTGSANVITLNLNRIIQNYFRGIGDGTNEPKKRDYKTESFELYFRSIIQRVIKYHKAFKNLLYDTENKGLLTASTAGYIKMNKLYSTIGVNGFNESAEFVGLTCNYNDDYKDFCDYITSIIVDEENKIDEPKYRMNLEFVPAESLGGKNYRWDKSDGYWVPNDRVLYNSYFYLAEDPETTPIDKLKMHGKEFTKHLTGGVGCHINLDTHLSKKQYSDLMDIAIKYGTSYYTFNVINCECKDCGYIEKVRFTQCPKCGSTNTEDWTRIIGYLRPVSAYEKSRAKEATKRIYSKM